MVQDEILNQSPVAFAHYQITAGEAKKKTDYQIIHVNDAFEIQFELKAKDICFKSALKSSLIKNNVLLNHFDYLKLYKKQQQSLSMKKFCENTRKWYELKVFSHKKGYFSVLYFELSNAGINEFDGVIPGNFKIFFHQSSEAIVLTNEKLFFQCNDAAVQLLGYRSREQMLSVHKREVFPIYQPNGKPSQRMFEEMKSRAFEKGYYRFHWCMIHPSGKEHIYEISFTPMLFNGEKILYSIYKDLTDKQRIDYELKISRERFQLVLENAFDGIYMIQGEKFIYVNKPFCDIFEYSYEEIINEHFDIWSTFTSESRKIVKERYQARIEGKSIPNVYEIQIVTKNGNIKDLELSTTEIERDRIPIVMGIIRDTTKIKKNRILEQEISLARKEAAFKQNFLATMSHEIRTPLTGILGMTDILTNTKLDETQKDYLNTIIDSSESLRSIINLILDYSKLEAGQMKITTSSFRIRRVLENTHKLFPALSKKDIKFKTTIEDHFPEFIIADRPKIMQIISNLLTNAVKFTCRGQVEIVVDYQKTDDLGKNDCILVKVSVKDTGIGIARDNIDKLFQPFFQVPEHHAKVSKGTGLGLSICKQLSKLMGGEIGVQSKKGEGSTFWFTFSARIADQADLQMVPENMYQNDKKKQKSLNILVVEDNVVSRKVIGIMLNYMGHNTTFASNGKIALNLYKPHLFDLILMDIQMPVMDGIKATKELKSKYHDLCPVVGLSANAFSTDREKYLNEGMDAYLTKPLVKEDFEKVLGNLSALKVKTGTLAF